jgi:opacity protein-like surface antigen
MKKLFFILALGSLLMAPMAMAQVQPGDTTYSVSLHVGYGHNLTYGSMANFDLDAYMPINKHFEMQANIRTSTSNVHTLGVQLRPKFVLPVGELYLEDRLMMRFVARDQVNEVLHAISLGYRMQYVNVQFGLINRVMMPLPYERNTLDKYIVEPFQLLYRVEGFVRPMTSLWNISIAISNADNYMIERPWTPMLYLGGWYDVDEHWRVRLSGKYKNAGMFHMNAHYYAAEVRVGAEYRF